MAIHFADKRCVACEGGVPPLTIEEVQRFMPELDPAWEFDDEDNEIERTFKFSDFKEAMRFVNHVAELAENEGHHPDLKISYNKVKVKLSTHAIDGLSENDFIMAAKIDKL